MPSRSARRQLSAARQMHYEQRVIDMLYRHGELSRKQLSELLSIGRSTISEVTSVLLEQGIIVEVAERVSHGPGRPTSKLVIDPRAGQFIGIDFGHLRVRSIMMDASHTIIGVGEARYSEDATWETRAQVAQDLIRRIEQDHHVHSYALQGIAIGIPGSFSPRLNLQLSPLTEQLRDVQDMLTERFSKAYDVPVMLSNNIRFAGLAEATWDPDERIDSLIYIRLSEGIGSCLFYNGQPIEGCNGFAGEIGHIVADPEGTLCRCGKRGCLETVASVPQILAQARAIDPSITTIHELASRARHQEAIDHLIRDTGHAIGKILGHATVLFNPSHVILGGTLPAAIPGITHPIAEALGKELLPITTLMPQVLLSRHGENAALIGAITTMFYELHTTQPHSHARPVLHTPSRKTP